MQNTQNKEWHQFRLIIQKSLEDSLNSQESRFLQDTLLENADARRLYIDYLMVHTRLFSISDEILNEESHRIQDVLDEDLMKLSEYEKIAPTIDISKEKPQRNLIQNVGYPTREKRIISKLSIFFLAINVAAILFIALFVRFVPVRGKSYAYVSGVYQAKLQGMQSSLQVGQYLDGKLIKLEKGLLKIQMNDGSEVLLEAPAEVSLEDDDQLFLIRGKLTANVPKEAVGFTVRTPSASIIDYGTEFGVKVDRYAKTEAHVLKGNIKIGVGSNPRILEEILRLSANQAACVSGQTLREIPFGTNQFVYNIPSPFELMAKSLGASVHLRLQSDNIGSFSDVMRALAAEDIEINPDLAVVPGPFSGHGSKSYAFRIEGADSTIKIKNVSTIQQNSKGDYSIGCWIRFDEIKQQIIYSGHVYKPEGFRLRSLSMKEEGSLRHFASNLNFSGTMWGIHSPDALRPGQWYFVMISRNAGDAHAKYMYINGKRVAGNVAKEGDDTIKPFDSFQFGGDVGSSRGFKGEIAEILLFPKALNDKEVEQLYESAIEN